MADAALAAAIGGFFVYQLIASLHYPAEAALFPRIIGTLGLLFAIAVISAAVRGQGAGHYKTDRLERRNVVIAVAAPVIYGFALWLLGYWPSTLVALVAFPRLVGFRRWLLVTVTAVATTVLFGILLHYMQVRLPLGVLFTSLTGG